MSLTKPKKYTNIGTWVAFIIFVIADILKVFFVFFPLAGEIVDEIISGVEVIGGGSMLFMSGFFAPGGPESANNLIWFLSIGTADAIPFINVAPFTSPAIYHRIKVTQKADEAAMQEYRKKVAVEKQKRQQQQMILDERAFIARQNAQMRKDEAMEISLAQLT